VGSNVGIDLSYPTFLSKFRANFRESLTKSAPCLTKDYVAEGVIELLKVSGLTYITPLRAIPFRKMRTLTCRKISVGLRLFDYYLSESVRGKSV
jgi:hypothetical protein